MNSVTILDPDFRFDALRRQLAGAGWVVVDQAVAPILPGEPEHAVFERDTGRRMFYTFNPVCRLRLLDCAAAGNMAATDALPRVDAGTVRRWLDAVDERTVLRGILAAAQLADGALADAVQAHAAHPRPALAQAATRVAQRLRGAPAAPPATAQQQALAMVEALRQSLTPLLATLAQDRDGSLAATLRPHAGDGARAFRGAAAALAQRASDAAWARQPPRVTGVSAGCPLQIHLAPAGMLADENVLSREFPGAWRQISPFLDPHRVWVRWKYVPAGQASGMAYDGLVWLDDHWAWFPKPWRMLAPLLAAPH